jgi:hypothetical protein
MVGTLQRIAKLLCTEPLTAVQVANAIGTISQDYGGSLQVVVRPSDAAFSEADIGREYGTQNPSTVGFELANPKSTTVAQLRSAFGEYSEGPKLHFDSPTEIMFQAIWRASPSVSCALIAQVDPGAHGVADGTVSKVTLRRDKL